jgi:hypothetical protein
MAAINAPTTIMDPNVEFVERPVEDRTTGVGIAVCVGQVIDRVRDSGGVIEATTPGLFMMPEGLKEYPTFLEMLRDQPQLPDPVFKEGEVSWTVEDAGFPLDKLDEYDNEFKKMYEDMFSRLDEFGTMGAGEFEMRLRRRQNELSESKYLEGNGGGPVLISARESSVHTSQHPTTPVHGPVPLASSGTFLHPSEEGSYETGTEADDERAGSPVDS